MAYGARLESVLGESPRGFESPILREQVQVQMTTRWAAEKSGSIFEGFWQANGQLVVAGALSSGGIDAHREGDNQRVAFSLFRQ